MFYIWISITVQDYYANFDFSFLKNKFTKVLARTLSELLVIIIHFSDIHELSGFESIMIQK